MASNDLGDPKNFRECGKFHYYLEAKGEAVVSIVCEKCMIFGSFLTIQNGNGKQIGLVEIGVHGLDGSFSSLKTRRKVESPQGSPENAGGAEGPGNQGSAEGPGNV